MSLSADLIVVATEGKRTGVVLHRKSPCERGRVFTRFHDRIHCLAILANQLRLLELHRADTRRCYEVGDYQKAFNYLLSIPVD